MNPELQKKWFVYLTDHHEGPFDAQELSQKQKTGLINAQNFVWKEGMTDWIPISDVPELIQDMKKFDVRSVSPAQEKKIPTIKSEPVRSKKLARTILIPVALIPVFLLGGLSLTSRYAGEEIHSAIRPTLKKVVNRLPLLGSVFYLAPKIPELKSEVRAEMDAALKSSPLKTVQISFAISQTNPNRPVLYLATNLPSRTRFDVYLIGNGDTLLNRLQFQSQLSIQTEEGMGKSEALLLDDGQALPKGDYQIWVTESKDQDEEIRKSLGQFPSNRPSTSLPDPVPNSSQFVVNKTVFIGGARDETYLTKLKSFHEKIKENSEKELVELRQYADTLVLQFESLNGEFEKILRAKKINPKQKENWKSTTKQWKDINAQLEQTIQTWSKETLQNEFFYGSAFELVKSSYDSLKKLFEIENEFVENPADRNLFLIQHGKAVSESRQSLDQLKGKIELILKAPKTAVGLPKREER